MKGMLLDGFLEYFNDGVFKDSWETRYFKFFDDGILEMFDDKKDKKPNERVNLRDVCNFLCVGHFTKNVPSKPKLPAHSNPALLLCFPKDEKKDPDEIIWVMFTSMDQLNDWMKTFISTFPGGKRSASAERDREERYVRDRRERSRERNRPVSARSQTNIEVVQSNQPAYDPTSVANNLPRNPGPAGYGSVDGWNFNNNLPTGVNFGFGMGWSKQPGYNPNEFVQPPPNIIINNTVINQNF